MFIFQDTFTYASSHWTTSSIHNVPNALNINNDEEGKFASFNEMKVTSICVGMRTTDENISTTRFKEVKIQTSTLLEMFKDGTEKITTVGRRGWLDLVPDSVLQPNCNKEGFNIMSQRRVKVRLGIVANNEDDCGTPNSLIGFGAGSNGDSCGKNVDISCGVFTVCNGNSYMVKPMTGYIFIR